MPKNNKKPGQWVERYVYDVSRRLPEKEREEVERELTANIADMLPDGAEEKEIEAVLQELGAPRELAEKYRQSPRYLISPAIYDEYIRILKLIVPLVGGIVFAIGAVMGVFEPWLSGESGGTAAIVANIIGRGWSMGIAAVFHAALWTTVGFVIAERTGEFTEKKRNSRWKLSELPEIPPAKKYRIPLAETVVELVAVVVSYTIFALMAFDFLGSVGAGAYNPFNIQALQLFIPLFLTAALLDVATCILKIIKRRWTGLVCVAVLVTNLVAAGAWMALITSKDIFKPEIIAALEANGDIATLLASFDITLLIPIGYSIILIVAVISCVNAVYKTIKSRKAQ